MAIGTLYISHQDFDFSSYSSKFLNKKNLTTEINNTEVEDYHTSLEDVGLKFGEIIQKLLVHCKEIKFLDLSWEKVINSENHATYAKTIDIAVNEFNATGAEDVIKHLTDHCNFHRQTRKTTDPVLWTAGASLTSAVGVKNNERYGHLLANKLNVDEVQLALTGSSIWDAADQLIRSDIQKDDIVVWGLPPAGRVEAVVGSELMSFPSSIASDNDFFDYKIDHFFSNTQYLVGLREIYQVINFCNKVEAKLYIVSLTEPAWLPLALRTYERFIDLEHCYDDKRSVWISKDYGTDGYHPGPEQHKEYAKKIFKFIKEK